MSYVAKSSEHLIAVFVVICLLLLVPISEILKFAIKKRRRGFDDEIFEFC